MDQAQQLISLYQTGFRICMGISILGFLSAVFMFFKFDIRTIFAVRTGRAAKKTIEKMAEENAMTGRLRQDEIEYSTGGLSGGTTAPQQAVTAGQTEPLHVGAGQTTPLGKAAVPTAPVPKAATPVRAVVPAGFKFVITENQVVIHTNELI